jgi:hypothetical protein
MKQETVLDTDGMNIVTESGIKTPIGNRMFETGETVWVDEKYVFGHDGKSRYPIINNAGVDEPATSNFIVLCDDDGNCSIFNMSFDKENEPLRPSHIDLRVNICEKNSYGITGFCYNKKGTKFAFTSRSWDDDGNYVKMTMVTEAGIKSETVKAENGLNNYAVDCYFDMNDDLIITLVLNNIYFSDSYKEDGTHTEDRGTAFKYLYYKNLKLDHTDDRTSQVVASMNRLREELLAVTDPSRISLIRTKGARGGGKSSIGSGGYGEWTQGEVSAATAAWITANSYPAINSEFIYTLESYSGITDFEGVKFDFDTKPVPNYKLPRSATPTEYYAGMINVVLDSGYVTFFTYRDVYIGTSLGGNFTPVITGDKDTGTDEVIYRDYDSSVLTDKNGVYKNAYWYFFSHYDNKRPLLDMSYSGFGVTGDSLDTNVDYSLSYSNYSKLATQTCKYENKYTVRNVWRYYGFTSTDTYSDRWWWRETITVDQSQMTDKTMSISYDMKLSNVGDGYSVEGTSNSSYGYLNTLVISKDGWSFDLTNKGPLGNPNRPIITTGLGEDYLLVTYYSFMGVINKKKNTIKYAECDVNSYNRDVLLIEGSSYSKILSILGRARD